MLTPHVPACLALPTLCPAHGALLQCSWQLVPDPPVPTVGNEYLMALRCINGDVFASGLSTSAPLCYRRGSDTTYTLTFPNLAAAASSATLAATPTGVSAVSRLTAFIGSSNAWVAKLSADAVLTGATVRVVRAIPPATPGGAFTCPAVGGPESTATPNLNVIANPNANGRLYNVINTATNGMANVGSLTTTAGAPQRFNIPLSITAPAAMCAQLADPAGAAGSTSLVVTPSTVASCSSMGFFRAVAPAQGNGGSCVLSGHINCTVNGWGRAALAIPLTGAGIWAGAVPNGQTNVLINVVSNPCGLQHGMVTGVRWCELSGD